MWLALGLFLFTAAFGLATRMHFWSMQWWLIGPLLAAIRARPKIENTRVLASADGLRVGGKLYPRAKFRSALLRREAGRTWVILRGKGLMESSNLDVEVESDEAADKLCAELALDAKNTTAEFSMMNRAPRTFQGVLMVGAGLMIVASVIGLAARVPLMPLALVSVFVAFMLIGIPLMIFAQRAKVVVGADGIVVKQAMKKSEFVSHAEVESVSASGAAVIVTRKHGEPIKLEVAGETARKKDAAERELHAQSIAWRIQKAREAFVALAGDVPQAALVLDRAGKTARAWLDDLRRAGAGANATFRGATLSREQLLRVVESTTAAARERLAAAVALHEGLTADEKPRIRVAAELCAEPALRERMVRVVDAPTDDELMAALEESESLKTSA